MKKNRRGVVLLEALVALTILGVTGLSLISVLSETTAAMRRAVRVERSLEQANRLLTAVSLLTRDDLVQRLGKRRIGEFVLEVERPERGLYRVSVADTGRQEAVRLVTVLFRPEN